MFILIGLLLQLTTITTTSISNTDITFCHDVLKRWNQTQDGLQYACKWKYRQIVSLRNENTNLKNKIKNLETNLNGCLAREKNNNNK